MRYLELIPFSYLFNRCELKPSDRWYCSFVILCQILHTNINRTGNNIEFKQVIDTNGIPYITTHSPITELQEKWIQTFIQYTQKDKVNEPWKTSNLEHILKICGYQKYTEKDKSIWYKSIAYSLMTIELNKDDILCTQWFCSTNGDPNDVKIWKYTCLEYQSSYTLFDICTLEAQTGKGLFDFYNLIPIQLDSLIPIRSYWENIL